MNAVNKFAQFLREKRIEERITLREFCKKTEQDPSNYSKLERGKLRPPQKEEVLKNYAKALNIEYKSNEWFILTDLAATGNHILPADIASDEEILEMLPAFFRTVRGRKPTSKDIDQLIDLLKKEI